MRKPVSFFSQGVRLVGDLYLPDDVARGEKRAGIVLCHGYTGVRNIYPPQHPSRPFATVHNPAKMLDQRCCVPS
jgi:hypothetical protein